MAASLTDQQPAQKALRLLKQYVQAEPQARSPTEQEEDTVEQLSDLLSSAEEPSTSYGTIPVFHQKQPEEGCLRARLKHLARLQHLALCSNNVLGQLQLDDVWFCLLRHATNSASNPDESRLHYDDFCQAGTECLETLNLPAVRPYFTAIVFLKMTKDAQGMISVPCFHHYVVRRNAMLQTMIHMGCFDEDGDGALLDSQLQSYIAALVPELPALQGLQASMSVVTYAQIAARKFLFFLGKKGKVKIRDLVMSPMWSELMELRAGADLDQPQEGWFSFSSAERVRNMFLQLDRDRNNHLSKQEFGANAVGSFSQIFLDRLHEEHVTSSKHTRAGGNPNQMDFGAFLDFMLAWENRASPAGLAYFMPVLDLKGRGYFTQADIHIFLREIYKMWVDCGLYPELNMEDVKDEIFDMAQPEDPLHITSRDLQKCGMASTILGMLVDVNLFWEYDNRETLMQRDKEEQGK